MGVPTRLEFPGKRRPRTAILRKRADPLEIRQNSSVLDYQTCLACEASGQRKMNTLCMMVRKVR